MRACNVVCTHAVAHNGVFSKYSHGEKYSDTQKFVSDILSDETVYENLHNRAIQNLINKFVGSNKVSIITHENELYMFGDMHRHNNGNYYSNYSYRMTSLFPSDRWSHKTNKIECWICGKKTSYAQSEVAYDADGLYIEVCLKCFDQIERGLHEEYVTDYYATDYMHNDYSDYEIDC